MKISGAVATAVEATGTALHDGAEGYASSAHFESLGAFLLADYLICSVETSGWFCQDKLRTAI